MLRVAELRKKRNMTQAELARAVGIAQPSLSDLENGNTNPAFETLIKLAKVLECSLDELVDLESAAS
jgi:transcriptional regulator with XRE-family HTH domain